MKPRPSPQRKARPQAKPAPIARVMWAYTYPSTGEIAEPIFLRRTPPIVIRGGFPDVTVAVIELTPENWERMVEVVAIAMAEASAPCAWEKWHADSQSHFRHHAQKHLTALGLTAPESRQSKQGGKGGNTL